MAKSIKPNLVVELGCGLGEIVRRVPAKRCIGLDVSSRVVAAARFLGQEADFHTVQTDQMTQFYKSLDQEIDLLIMVNWPHEIPMSKITEVVSSATKACGVRYLLIDTIVPRVPGYPYHHDAEDIAQLGDIIAFQEGADGVRNLHLLKVG